MDKFIQLKDFALSWRFSDDKYNVLPQDDLDKISFLSATKTKQLWDQYISIKYDHIMKIPKTSDKGKIIFKVDWNKEDDYQLILNNTNVKGDQKILFFWSNKCAVVTIWKIFIKYWSDFCYPDDDNSVLVILSNKDKIYYCEETFIINER